MKRRRKAWAILHSRGDLAIFGGNLPVYWLKPVATLNARRRGESRVVPCIVEWDAPDRRKKARSSTPLPGGAS